MTVKALITIHLVKKLIDIMLMMSEKFYFEKDTYLNKHKEAEEKLNKFLEKLDKDTEKLDFNINKSKQENKSKFIMPVGFIVSLIIMWAEGIYFNNQTFYILAACKTVLICIEVIRIQKNGIKKTDFDRKLVLLNTAFNEIYALTGLYLLYVK